MLNIQALKKRQGMYVYAIFAMVTHNLIAEIDLLKAVAVVALALGLAQ